MGDEGRVVIDRERGLARIGRFTVAIADAGVPRGMRIGSTEGPVLRPISFGERTWLVQQADEAADPPAMLGAGVLGAATVSPGVPGIVEPLVLEILALELAGASHEGAPSFDETLVAVAQATGWSFDQLAAAEAFEVDRLVMSLPGSAVDDDWCRIVLVDDVADDLMGVWAGQTGRLLQRVRPSATDVDTRTQQTSTRDGTWTAPPRPEMGWDGLGDRPQSFEDSVGRNAVPNLMPPLWSASVDLARVHRRTGPAPSVGQRGDRRDSDARWAEAIRGPGAVTWVTLDDQSSTPVPSVPIDDETAPAGLQRTAVVEMPLPNGGGGATASQERQVPDWGLERLAVTPASRSRALASGWDEPQTADSHQLGDAAPLFAATFDQGRPVPGSRLESSPETIADVLAALLHDEADLRGLDR